MDGYRLTPHRMAWLQTLKVAPAKRSRTVVGFACMQAGWTEWNYVDKADGKPISEDEAIKRYGVMRFDRMEIDGERLTEMGRWLVAFGRVGGTYGKTPSEAKP